MTAPLTLIAALACNRVIGRNNRLPWRLPADLQFFKQTTMGKPLLMGRRTWESIGRPLPGRKMIVLSGHPGYRAAGCGVAHTLDEALALAGDVPEIMVIGGAALYEQTLALAGRLVLTRIEAEIPGDVRFPVWDERDWRLDWEESHPADADHAWPWRFQRWKRVAGDASFSAAGLVGR
ncbi:MAG: type 3 dihydrofolate reductase [Candidatus Contendobacter sp.]|nr:type 3 dihydrofolate reductase [Candidatus Contendobacter sp.]